MNIILNLFDEQFVLKLFRKRILPKYPSFAEVKKIEIIPVKKQIWDTTYHVVIEFKTTFLTIEGKRTTLPIFCTAHSSEPRRNVYTVLKYLWDHSFARGSLTIPHPLFYSNTFRATFYRGVKGKNLKHYIQDRDYETIRIVTAKAANWFAKLHKLPVDKALNFNRANSRVKTAIPGAKKILEKFQSRFPQKYPIIKSMYEQIIKKEEDFFRSTSQRWLIHGDAHPENVIPVGKHKLVVVDFADFCLADFARDIGSFLQQFEYMSQSLIDDKNFIDSTKNLFLQTYANRAKINIDKALLARINNYYYWTALRTVAYFALKSQPDPDRAFMLLDWLTDKMQLK